VTITPRGDLAAGVTRLGFDAAASAALVSAVPSVADEAVRTIVAEVPSYARAFSGAMGATIRRAVEMALVNFLELARLGSTSDPAEPIAPSTAAAYDLGRGEARSGRSMDALLAAYRVGARVSWRGLSRVAVAAGVSAETMGAFAELVFAYIDALSAASLTGHADELAMSGRARERYLERLAELLVRGADETVVAAAAYRAEWMPPRTLTAVLLPEDQVRTALGLLDARSLFASAELPGLEADGLGVLLVPDTAGRDRTRLLHVLEGRGAIVGPERPWASVQSSYHRAVRARALRGDVGRGAPLDTDEALPELVLHADPEALADLRAIALAPLVPLRPGVRARLEETLRSWLLNHGRRELIAAELFVHPQTVRYRMGQLREIFGDRLDDPGEVLRLTLALAGAGPGSAGRAGPTASGRRAHAVR
jgi:hypothetical protein